MDQILLDLFYQTGEIYLRNSFSFFSMFALRFTLRNMEHITDGQDPYVPMLSLGRPLKIYAIQPICYIRILSLFRMSTVNQIVK